MYFNNINVLKVYNGGVYMKVRLADYVADFLVSHGVTDVFSVVGGGAMHLNDALGHNENLKVTYNHHEQAGCTSDFV